MIRLEVVRIWMSKEEHVQQYSWSERKSRMAGGVGVGVGVCAGHSST